MEIWLRVLSQVNKPLFLTRGYIIVLIVYAQATWFINPNHYPNFVSVGKFLMTDNNLSDGLIQDGVIFNPANLNVFQQNFNLVSFITIPFSARGLNSPM